MIDERTMRQVIIDRITAYNDALEFYNPEDKKEYDFDSMSDLHIVATFEMIVFNNHKVKQAYRDRNPDIRAPRR